LDIFHPLNRTLAREALGIDTPGPVLLAAAQSFIEERKGGAILVESLRSLVHRPLTLLTLGAGRLPIEVDGIHLRSLGYIDHERTKVLAYNAADLFVHPAPVDNLPNVVMESIACGTPVVGFRVGGIPEMVRTGQTGWLANEVCPEAFARAIESALADLKNGLDLRPTCRRVAEAEYTSELQAQRYLKLYQELVDDVPLR
jgi:glycosyltransferase involved in cell wall biosynthesis